MVVDNIKKEERKKCTHFGFEPNNGSFRCKECREDFTLEEVDEIVFKRLDEISKIK